VEACDVLGIPVIHGVRAAAASPWRPASPCTPELCVPSDPPAAGPIRRLRRYLVAAIVIAAGLVLASLPRLALPPALAAFADRRSRTALWARAAAKAVGVRLHVRTAASGTASGTAASGTAVSSTAMSGSAMIATRAAGDSALGSAVGRTAGRGVLVVANHVSWLDVVLLLAWRPGRIVAKQEVLDYPVLGTMAARAGTIGIERDRLSELPSVVAAAAEALRAGDTVVVFPEATTWCGRVLGEFRPAFFQAAIDAGAAIRPVAVRYVQRTGTATAPADAVVAPMTAPMTAGTAGTAGGRAAGASTTLPALVGEDTLVTSLRRVVAAGSLVAEAIVLPEIPPGGRRDRRALARAAQAAIAGALESRPRARDTATSPPLTTPAAAAAAPPRTAGRAAPARQAVHRPA
jgi:1-acyl-sn-glycerol-3-phosphate acyltransferase